MGLVLIISDQQHRDVWDNLNHEEITLRLMFRDAHPSVDDMSPLLFEDFVKSVVKLYAIRQELFKVRRPMLNYDYLHSKMEVGINPRRCLSKCEIPEHSREPHHKGFLGNLLLGERDVAESRRRSSNNRYQNLIQGSTKTMAAIQVEVETEDRVLDGKAIRIVRYNQDGKRCRFDEEQIIPCRRISSDFGVVFMITPSESLVAGTKSLHKYHISMLSEYRDTAFQGIHQYTEDAFSVIRLTRARNGLNGCRVYNISFVWNPSLQTKDPRSSPFS